MNPETKAKVLNRCQQEFEQGWKVNLPLKPVNNGTGKEAELLSEQYYATAKAKRQDLRLVQFIGVVFKVNMLIKEIMYVLILTLLIIGMNVSFDCWVEQRIPILNWRKLRVCTISC